MSSHREAPEITKDPVADSTDVYAFVSPDRPDTVTLIANYIPLEGPPDGPNFHAFGDEMLYKIHVDNDADARADITFQFRFQTQLLNPDTFLYNTGPILSLDSPNWNRRQTYTLTRVTGGRSEVLAWGLTTPPCNIRDLRDLKNETSLFQPRGPLATGRPRGRFDHIWIVRLTNTSPWFRVSEVHPGRF